MNRRGPFIDPWGTPQFIDSVWLSVRQLHKLESVT